MDRCTPGLPVHHQLPEFTQTHVHFVGDAIQPSHPLLSPLTSLIYSPVFKHGDGRRVDPEYTVALISLGEEKSMDPGWCLDVPLSHLALMSAVSY